MRRHLVLSLCSLFAACGDSGGATVSGTDGATSTGSASLTGTGTDPTTPTTQGPGSTPTDGSGSVSATGTSDTTAAPLTTGTSDPVTSDPGTTTTGGPVSSSTGDTTMGVVDTTASSSTTGGPGPVCGDGLVDVGEACDDGNDVDKDKCSNTCMFVPCGEQEGGGGNFDFSYIWIANSGEGTVSKIDTTTLKEVGRYRTDSVQASSPSRTAVNVDGRFAAVANRTSGSVTMYAADPDDCKDNNGNGMIDTSTGPGDVKAWGADECQLWSVKIAPSNNGNEQKGPRPLGWDFDDQDPQTCEFKTQTLWMGWYGNPGDAYFWHLDLEGQLIAEVKVPVWGSLNSWGPYGGAVDKNHDFWVAGWHGPLVRINAADNTYKMWNDPVLANVSSYGMALDGDGDPWFGGCSGQVVTFDAKTEQFITVGTPGGCLRGLQVDQEGRGWIAKNGGGCLVQVDTINNTIVNANINLPGCITTVGVSIDIEGFVWVVDQSAQLAFKVDPDTLQAQTVGGLVGPYTYSDMTGAGIRLQAIPQ
jgi:cysteine-rich repeat protein